MKKISTLFKKDPNDLGRVVNELNPENEWVINGEGIATRKFDGICSSIIGGDIHKRFDVKKGKKVPEGAIPCQEPDSKSGHHPHWVKCDRSKPEDKYFFEAFDALENKEDGTYELCGETVSTERFSKNFNVEKVKGHKLIKHASEILELPELTFEALRDYLSNPDNDIEGIVFHHKTDGRMCKLRKKDFGISRKKEEMIILFPSEPFSSKEVDSAFHGEYEAAKLVGFKVHLFDHDEFVKNGELKTSLVRTPIELDNQVIILRGWMLNQEQYASLYGRLWAMGFTLINTPDEYVNCHHFPKSYPHFMHESSRAWWSNDEYRGDIEWDNINWQPVRDFFGTDVIIKDYVKSEKNNPDLFILPMSLSKEEFALRVKQFVEARGKLFNKGIVFKAVVSLKKYENVTNEWRIFYLNNEIFYLNLNVESENELPKAGFAEFLKWLKISKDIKSNFFTIDVAEKEDGTWMILETGDGQVSGLPSKGMPLAFYTQLKEKF